MPEHTIAENLQRLINARQNIDGAIVTKEGTVNPGDGLEEYPADILTIPSGGGGSGAATKDVNFYDYEGTVVNSYTAAEFAELVAMPDNPTHEGLTAQGWNWSLADAKAYVASYGKLNIGQMYNTDDGALRIYIRLREGRLSPTLGICIKGTVTVNWDDGSATETMTGTSVTTLVYRKHTYASAGDYVISVLPSTGSTIGFGQRGGASTILCKSQGDALENRQIYLTSIYKIEIPDSAASLSTYAFANCYGLTSVTIPDSVTSLTGSFSNCYSLTSVIIPGSVTGIDSLYNCYSLTSVVLPARIANIYSSAFYRCYNLISVNIPASVTDIGGAAFQFCYSLTSVTIPDSVTGIGNGAFNQCYGLGFIKFTATTPPTVSNSNAWLNIPTDCTIYAPALVINLYMNGTNYPIKSTYTYAGFATYESGVTLPTTTSDETHILTWYANIDDLKAGTNPITVGNGNEVYAKATAI